MNVSAIFIRRPIATSLLMLGIGVFGIIAYRALSVSDLPSVDYPMLNVNASLPGASPGTMASAVATTLERQFTTIAGLNELTSSSSLGSTNVTLQFDLDRDIDGAAVDVQTAIAEAMPLLPAGMPAPPAFHKANPSATPIMMLSLMSDSVPLWITDEYAENMIAQRISAVPGVAQVVIWGSQKYAVRVQVDPDKLASRHIGLNEVASALANWNVNLPTGTLYGPNRAYTVQADGQLMNAAQFRPLIVSYVNGRPVYLREVANVIDSVENDKNASWFYDKNGGKRAINLMVIRQPGTNTIEVTDAVRGLLPMFQSMLPPTIKLLIRGDLSKNIREAFHDIQVTMAVTLGLVIGVIFIFLRNGSATIIPSMALPFSLLGTFAVMYLCDYTLDQLSMMALILCIGFVVDDAIVMLENTVRHMEKGETPLEAALNGSREIGFTIVSMTLSLAAVFIPVLFMSGILGRLFREFAVTICVAILISGLVSITLTPMLCSRFLRSHADVKHGRLYRVTQRGFDAMFRGYARSLGHVLEHRYIMAGVFVAVLGATGYLFAIIPKGFIPEQDMDSLSINTQAAQGTSYFEMVRLTKQVAEVLRHNPNVESFLTSVGGNGSGSVTNGMMHVMLKPRRERTLSVGQVIQQLRPQVSRFPGMNVFMSVPQAISVGGHHGRSSYEFTMVGQNTDELYRQGQQFEKVMKGLPSVLDVNTDLEMRMPQVSVDINRDKAASRQLNIIDIENALYDAYGPRWASTIYAPTDQFKVLMELLPGLQTHADYLSKVFFKSTDGNLVPLDSIAKLTQDVGPQSIAHTGQFPSLTLSFNIRPGVSLGQAVDEIEAAAKRDLPATITTKFTGTARVFQDSMQNLTLLLILAIAVVYIVLGVLYESYIHPLTILSGLPSAGFGALLTLVLFHNELNIYSFVGLIMLIGLVKKNAIMQIDFALEAERKEGKSPKDAVYEGCLIRFRPIMMTTMAALLGTIPIALGWGAGGEARRPLGLTVVGGLAFSQLITLYLTPVVYTYNAALLERWRRWKNPQAAIIPALPETALTGVK